MQAGSRVRVFLPLFFFSHPLSLSHTLSLSISLNQQDTKEYQNQRGTYIRVFRVSKTGGIKGEVKREEVVGE